MGDRPANLVPLTPYLLAGHGIFLAILVIIPLTLFAHFWGFMFGREWRAAIPDWASFHGQEAVLIAVLAVSYPCCVGGSLLTWAIREREARRYRRQRLGTEANPTARGH